HHAAHLGDAQAAERTLEQLFAQGDFERADLAAQSGLRQTQLHRGASHRALSSHHPEIKKVPVVEPIHGPHHTSSLPMSCIQTIYFLRVSRSAMVRDARGSSSRPFGRKPISWATDGPRFSRKGRSLIMT